MTQLTIDVRLVYEVRGDVDLSTVKERLLEYPKQGQPINSIIPSGTRVEDHFMVWSAILQTAEVLDAKEGK